MTSNLQENLLAQPVVKAFGLEDRATTGYGGKLDQFFRSSIRLSFLSSIYGLTANSIASAIQLTILGLGGWLIIRGDMSLGSLMAFLSLLPAVGAGLVWAPVAIWLLLTGAVLKGLVLIAFGVLVIGLVDNLARPMLVGKDTRMPDYLILLATIGGLAIFGINGFVVGPVIAAMFVAVWTIVAARTRGGITPER